jgi:KaiC/GvpD/RAD55 family RecA-like ATPase
MTNVDLLYNLIDSGRQGRNIGLKTGIDKLDEYTGGIQRGIYTLIFGLSGAGKSAVSLYMIYRTLRDNPDTDIKYIYFSLEMASELLLAKLMCLYMYEEFGVVISYTDLMS